MTETRFPNAPPQIATLPLDKRGYPVPWFVSWVQGVPEFVGVDPRKISEAHQHSLCWICGRRLRGLKAFTIGPMCSVNRISAEPPACLSCARFAVTACPFLSKPLAKRADKEGMNYQMPAGFMIERNPGVILIWGTQTYRAENHGTRQHPRLLFRIGSPIKIEWFSQGRTATRDEIIESIETGIPALREVAAQDGKAGIDELRRQLERAVKLVPAE
jgi:hypothetical protein